MLNVRELIDKGLNKAGAQAVVLAAPFDVPEALAAEFFRAGRVRGLVVGPQASGHRDVPVLGRWIGNDHSRLKLERHQPKTLLFLGSPAQIGGRILLEAIRHGVRRIVYLDPRNNDFAESSALKWLRSKCAAFSIGAVSRYRAVAPLAAPALSLGKASFIDGYRELYERAASLRLPANAFQERYALMAVGTLGPGGAERQLVYTARGLARQEHWRVAVSVENLTAPLANFHEATLRASCVPVHQVPLQSDALHCEEIAEIIDYFAKRYSFIGFDQVVHSILLYALFLRKERPFLLHTWMDACNVRAGVAAAIVGVPRLVLSCRSVAPDHFGIFQPYMRDGYKSLIDAVNPTILNNSRAGVADYARWLDLPPSAMRHLPNGFEFPGNVETDRQRARTTLGFEPDHIVLGGLMRCSEEKRPDLWVAVAMRFVDSGPRRRAVLYGDGPMHQALLRQVRARGLEQKILMPGVTDRAWETIAGFDIFLLTSRMEGLPNVMIEAQAVGVPVVSPAVGGAPETFLDGKTGFLVEDDTVASLVRPCIELAENAQLRSVMSQQATQYARSTFSADKMIVQTLTAYSPHSSRHETSSPREMSMFSGPSRFGLGKNWRNFVSRGVSTVRRAVNL
jgi:glycosyltransferase involved in cell wall biosynthesis